jgi:hypothetical protein
VRLEGLGELEKIHRIRTRSSDLPACSIVPQPTTLPRAPGDTKTTQENIEDWLELDEGDPGFQLLTEEEIAAVIFYLFIYFHRHYLYYYIFYFLFSKFFLPFRAIFCFINTDSRSIRMISPSLPFPNSSGLARDYCK